MPEVDGY